MSGAKSSLFGFALLSGYAASSIAGVSAETASAAPGIAFTSVTMLTTDYMYRGVSQTAGEPAIQGYIEATRKLLYLGVWGSNVDFGVEPDRAGRLREVADLELSAYGGVRPQWRGIGFDLGVFYYAYPGSLPSAKLDYVEFAAAAAYTVYDRLTFRGTAWWSPNESETDDALEGVELSASYAFKQVWFVSPTASALFGRQWGPGSGETYSYWNAGLTLGMAKKPALSFDVRYWDTDLDGCGSATVFQCGPRVVGTLTATF